MTRWRITLEYDGAPFQGWQRQAHGPSVQQAVEDALHAFSGERVTVNAAGRTDAGVHAQAQVATFDLVKDTSAKTVRDALNAHLRPQPVVVHEARPVPPDFHARFSAVARAYRYYISNQPVPLALARGRVWQVARPLHLPGMQEAAALLVGQQDFTSFRSSECQAPSPVKTVDAVSVTGDGGQLCFAIAAKSFLHHMVRNIMGSLVRVGAGQWSVTDFRMALAARDRRAAGAMAPPDGLYLAAIAYNAAEKESLLVGTRAPPPRPLAHMQFPSFQAPPIA